MAQRLMLTGAEIKLFINNKPYKEVQSVSFTVDYAEEEIFGIDSPYSQEISSTKVSVRGNVNGLRIKNSGGIQANNMRPLFQDIMSGPYISIRIQDRSTGEDILYVPKAKITRESHSAAIKSIYKLNFDFVGILPLFALDRSNG